MGRTARKLDDGSFAHRRSLPPPVRALARTAVAVIAAADERRQDAQPRLLVLRTHALVCRAAGSPAAVAG